MEKVVKGNMTKPGTEESNTSKITSSVIKVDIRYCAKVSPSFISFSIKAANEYELFRKKDVYLTQNYNKASKTT